MNFGLRKKQKTFINRTQKRDLARPPASTEQNQPSTTPLGLARKQSKVRKMKAYCNLEIMRQIKIGEYEMKGKA